MSTESGIPDFRSPDGLYHQHYNVPPETILSHSYFFQHPEEFFRFYRERMLPLEAGAHAAHRTLARWEREGKLLGRGDPEHRRLHQKAGSQRVYELHGSVLRNRCLRCGKSHTAREIRESEGVPRCQCGGTIKPDVVLYEESLDEKTLRGAVEAIATADLLIVGGTSLTVYPAAGLLEYYSGRLVLINRDETPRDGRADLILRAPIGQVLGAL